MPAHGYAGSSGSGGSSTITAPSGGATVGSRTVGLDVTSGSGIFDVGAKFTKSGTGGSSAKAALDVEVPLSGGRAMRVWNRNWTATYGGNYPDIPTYIGDRGQFCTQAWMTISGTFTGVGDACEITQPTNDTYMVGIWSDIGDAGLCVRASVAAGSYNFQGFDKDGRYTFRIDADGALKWGTSLTKAGEDVTLSRIAGPGLKLDGSLSLVNNKAVQGYKADGTTLVNIFAVDGSNNLNIGSAALGNHVQITPATGKEVRFYNAAASLYMLRMYDSTTNPRIESSGTIRPGNFTIATLPSAATVAAGGTAYATNGRRAGEGAGVGTGIPVWSDGTNWRTYYDNTVAAA